MLEVKLDNSPGLRGKCYYLLNRKLDKASELMGFDRLYKTVEVMRKVGVVVNGNDHL